MKKFGFLEHSGRLDCVLLFFFFLSVFCFVVFVCLFFKICYRQALVLRPKC